MQALCRLTKIWRWLSHPRSLVRMIHYVNVHSPVSNITMISAQLPSQAFDSLFPLSPNSSPEPAGRSELLPSGSMSSRQEDDDSDSSSASHRSSDQRRVRRLPCLNASCKKKFMSEHTRQTHMKSHQHKPRRSFPCTMGCSEQFSRQHDRFRHEVTKHGYQSKWTCDKCHGFFSSEKSLNSHKCSSGGRWKIIPQ